MNKKIRTLLATACSTLVISFCVGQTNSKEPDCITFSYHDLAAIRESIKNRKPEYQPSYSSLLKKANLLLEAEPEKVTDGDNPPGGDAHDFYSIGKFSWRNPNTPDGMPYVRGDGKFNEEAFGPRYDLIRFEKTVSNVNTLSLAWFYSGDEKYAAKASDLLKTWFINPQTRMNPSLKFASALPGVHDGMPAGIIFTVVLIEMTDHVRLLRLSKSWDNASDDQLKKWFADYNTWLTTSDFGHHEKEYKNNHGTWFAAQTVTYSLFSGSGADMKKEFELAKEKISTQIMPDGTLPLEQKRVEGFHYFIYGLKAFNVLASGLQKSGYDLWAYQTPDKKSLLLPYKFIIPYIAREKQWATVGELKERPDEQIIMLKQAAAKYDLPESKKALEYLNNTMSATDIRRLYIYP